MVSVFNPTWGIEVLHQTLRWSRWGVDDPVLFWGRFVVPGSAAVTAAGVTDHVGEEDRVNVYLALVPTNIPESEQTQINGEAQYTSHAVNLFVSNYGDSRVAGGNTEFNEPELARKYYEYFEDDVDYLAFVSQATQVVGFFGFHGLVQNAIGGIGLNIFDNSGFYGSGGRLQAVEGYPPGGWASLSTVIHEGGHQVGEYTDTWEQVGASASHGARRDRPQRACAGRPYADGLFRPAGPGDLRGRPRRSRGGRAAG